MKGLFIKDFKSMKQQKKYFLIIIVISVSMIFADDLAFFLGYIPFLLSILTLSTINYDGFDNGNAFLFTLPFSRKEYVMEKYLLALLLGSVGVIIDTVVILILDLVKNNSLIENNFMMILMIIPLLIIVLSIMIPIQLKFGAEKGIVTAIIAFLLLFVLVVSVIKILESFGIDIMERIQNLNIGFIVLIFIPVCVIVFLTSMNISFKIINNKEF